MINFNEKNSTKPSKKDRGSRCFMYVQQLEHLKVDINDFSDILNNSDVSEWAYIIHDKDLSENGNGITTQPHVHCVLKFENSRTISKVKEIFHDEPQFYQKWDNRVNNAFSYLIHETDDASENSDKHIYSVDDVVANFDFAERIKEIEKRVKTHRLSNKQIENLITDYGDRIISRDELLEKIGVANFASKRAKIDGITRILEEEDHKRWLKEFENHKTETIWLFGASGTGKSSYAKYLLKGKKYVILGSTRDPFQEYHGERNIISDEFRPNVIAFSDLLQILDPYNHDNFAPRRYHDVPLNLELIIITSVYGPAEFYKNSYVNDAKVDTIDQLLRRIYPINITTDFMKSAMPDRFDENLKHDEFEDILRF